MYKARFVNDNGAQFAFGPEGNNVFDLSGMNGVSVDIGTSQGFSQVGDTVNTRSITGQTLTIYGKIYSDIPGTKYNMRKVFTPLASGMLVINDVYFIRVFVKSTPSFSPVKDNGKFMLQLYAPYPLFKDINETVLLIGGVTSMFSFPVNYETPHTFGVKSAARYVNVINEGDMPSQFSLSLSTETQSTNITITNMDTMEYLKISGVLTSGQVIDVYRDGYGVLKMELTADGVTQDIMGRLDEGSNLFELHIGDNMLKADDDEGGGNLTARISFNTAVGVVYET